MTADSTRSENPQPTAQAPPPPPSPQALRKRAAYSAVDDLVRSGDRLGLGTGRTAAFVAERIAEKLRTGECEDIAVVPTSRQTQELCRELAIPVVGMNYPDIAGRLRYSIDSADEVNPRKQLIKGGGGAHTLEKIVEYNSDKLIIVVDSAKLVNVLGKSFPLPLEILPESFKSVRTELENEGFTVERRPESAEDTRPFISENVGYILDIYPPGGQGFQEGGDYDPVRMESYFKTLTGVIESGLFTRNIPTVYAASADGLRILD